MGFVFPQLLWYLHNPTTLARPALLPFCPFALLASWFPGYLAPGSSLNLPSSHLAGLSRPVMSSLDSSRCPFSPSYLQQTSSSSTPRSRHVFLLLLFSFSGLVFLIFLLFSKVINLLCREIRWRESVMMYKERLPRNLYSMKEGILLEKRRGDELGPWRRGRGNWTFGQADRQMGTEPWGQRETETEREESKNREKPRERAGGTGWVLFIPCTWRTPGSGGRWWHQRLLGGTTYS